MIEDDEDELEEENEAPVAENHGRKRLVLFLISLVIVLVVSTSVFLLLRGSTAERTANYRVVRYGADNEVVFYDLPKIEVKAKGRDGAFPFKFQLSLELDSIEDAQVVDELSSRLHDLLVNYTALVPADALNGSAGRFWFKEELMYRIKLAVAPIEVKNINFNEFDLKQ